VHGSKECKACRLAFWSCLIQISVGTRAVLPKFVVVFPASKLLASFRISAVRHLELATHPILRYTFVDTETVVNPLNPELNPICYLLALLEAHYFLHVSRIRVKLLTFRLLMSYIYGAPILDVSRSHTTTQHSR